MLTGGLYTRSSRFNLISKDIFAFSVTKICITYYRSERKCRLQQESAIFILEILSSILSLQESTIFEWEGVAIDHNLHGDFFTILGEIWRIRKRRIAGRNAGSVYDRAPRSRSLDFFSRDRSPRNSTSNHVIVLRNFYFLLFGIPGKVEGQLQVPSETGLFKDWYRTFCPQCRCSKERKKNTKPLFFFGWCEYSVRSNYP